TRFVVCGAPSAHRSAPGYGERIVEELRTLPNVEYLGQVAPARAQEIIEHAAVLLSTSDREGLPNTFLEAWTSGTPVVSLGVDPDGVIQTKRLGRVSPSVEEAVATVGALLKSPLHRDEIGDHARRHVATAHSPEAVVEAFEHAVDRRRSVGARDVVA